mmetsp:Transcript_58609/g.156708  ORF Transcript_58609/g.156708 Transcript_58609/m.156708 type:complete len:294 (-) Transcript_58609:1271-2152(-)
MQNLKQEAVVDNATSPRCVAVVNQRHQSSHNLGLQIVGYRTEGKGQCVGRHHTVVIRIGPVVVERAVKLSSEISSHGTDGYSILRRGATDNLANSGGLLHTANKGERRRKSLGGLRSLPFANFCWRRAPVTIRLGKLAEPTRLRQLSLDEPHVPLDFFPVRLSGSQMSNLHKLVNILDERAVPAQIRWPSAEPLLRHNIRQASVRVHQINHAIHEGRGHVGVVEVRVHALGTKRGVAHPAQTLIPLRAVRGDLHQIRMLRSNGPNVNLLQHFISKICGGPLLHPGAHCEASDV